MLRVSALLAIASAMPQPVAAQCLLCPAGPGIAARPDVPLQVEVSGDLDFNRVALTAPGGGSINVDPVARSRSVRGGLVSLGGLVMTAEVIVRGEPGRSVRISLPGALELHSAGGAPARISRFVTDLPPMPRLGPDGVLRFTIGGQLDVAGGTDGNYRGRIAITVDYQ